jgi:hypothetical protein
MRHNLLVRARRAGGAKHLFISIRGIHQGKTSPADRLRFVDSLAKSLRTSKAEEGYYQESAFHGADYAARLFIKSSLKLPIANPP